MNAADAECKRVNGVNASSPRQNTPRSSPLPPSGRATDGVTPPSSTCHDILSLISQRQWVVVTTNAPPTRHQGRDYAQNV